jgi:hypothetical protein
VARAILQRHQEQMGLLQRLQHGRAVGTRHQGLADLGIQRAQDAGAQQEVAHGRGLLGQDVFRQVFGHGTLRTREALDEIAVRAMALQRQRGQPQCPYPAFGLVQQPRQGLARQRAAAQAEELFGFGSGKPQQGRVDLQQLAAGAQPPQAQGRQRARADDQPATLGQLLRELAHQAQHGIVLQYLEIVDEQRERPAFARQRMQGLRQISHPLGLGGAQAVHGRTQAVQKARDIVVRRIQRQPGRGLAFGLKAFAHLAHGRGLAEAGRRAHQHHACAQRLGPARRHRRAHHLGARRARRTQLGLRHVAGARGKRGCCGRHEGGVHGGGKTAPALSSVWTMAARPGDS